MKLLYLTSVPTTMSTLLTSDLRSESKAFKRDKDHTAKWSRGARVAPGKSCTHDASPWGNGACQECAARPLPRDGRRNLTDYTIHRTQKLYDHGPARPRGAVARKVLQNDLNEVNLTSDASSGDEEIVHSSAAPLPDAEIMYSYDAPSGPSSGSDILSNAVMQAVKRFENKQTETLVKNEYDLVLDAKEMEDAYAGDAEDDFEVIEFEHLR